MRPVLALMLATGLWTAALLHPPTALAAARVSLRLKGEWRAGGDDSSGYAQGVAVAGNYAYVVDEGVGGLLVIDVSNPANPVRVGDYQTVAYDSDLVVVSNLIYVADGSRGLRILELSRLPWIEVSGLNPFTLRLSGEPGATLRVQRSSNLQDWEDWQAATLGDAPREFSDPGAAPTGARFFRAVEP